MEDSITKAVRVLNEAIEADHSAIIQLFRIKIPCGPKLVEHPTIQVSKQHTIGTFGLINGLFGTDETGYGFIEAEVDADENGLITKIYKFNDRRKIEKNDKK